MKRRAEILRELVRFDKPTAPLMRELKSFGWDWDGAPLIILKKDDLRSIMERFLAGSITAEQLHEWAENLEVREDVGFDEADNDLIDDVFFRLAVPEINEPLTLESVGKLRDALNAS